MGFALSWIAVRGKSPEDVWAEFDLSPTKEREAFPTSEFTGTMLSDGWYLLVVNRADHPVADDDVLQRLSSQGEVITTMVEEHVMFCESSGWKGGQRAWRTTHDADQGIAHLEVEGEPPASLAALRDRGQQQQNEAGGEDADVDYLFEVPIEVAHEQVGYRHDRDLPNASTVVPPFQVLRFRDRLPRGEPNPHQHPSRVTSSLETGNPFLRRAASLILIYLVLILLHGFAYMTWSGDSNEVPKMLVRGGMALLLVLGLRRSARWAPWLGILYSGFLSLAGAIALVFLPMTQYFVVSPHPIADFTLIFLATLSQAGALYYLLKHTIREMVLGGAAKHRP